MSIATLLSLVMIGALLLCFAGSAYAQVEWKVAGKALAELGLKETSVLGKSSTTSTLTIPWYATEVSCKAVTAESGQLKVEGASNMTLSFTECSLIGPPFVAETCKVVGSGFKWAVKGQLTEHGGKMFSLFSAAEAGKPLGTVQFEEKTECPLPLKNEITGSFTGEFEAGEREKQSVVLASSTALFSSDVLKFGTHEAVLKGNALLDLGGGFVGKSWTPGSYTPPPPPEGEGKLRVQGKVLATGEEAEFEGESGTGKLLIPGVGLTLECKKSLIDGNGSNLKFESLEHLHAEVHVLFHECIVVGTKFCTIYPTAADRTAKTNAGLILAFALLLDVLHTHSGVTTDYIVARPLEGTSQFTTLYIAGALCMFPPAETSIGGSVAFKLPEVSSELVEHEFQDITEAEEAELGVSMKWVNEPMTLDEGNGKVHLIGKFLTKKFSLD